MTQSSYTVRLDSFQGPMDLLLYLIRRAEVEITDIPIASITDQYIEFLQQIDQIDVEQAAEFLLLAATLVEIKSRVLKPAEARINESQSSDNEDLTDPRSELIQQLLAYKKYREAAADLEARKEEWEQHYPVASRLTDEDALAEAQDRLRSYEIEDLHILDLFEAFQNIIEAVDLDRIGDHEVKIDDTPIELHQADLLDRIQRAGRRLELISALQGRSRSEMIGLFLALLELVRDRRVLISQESDDSILLELNSDPDEDIVESEND